MGSELVVGCNYLGLSLVAAIDLQVTKWLKLNYSNSMTLNPELGSKDTALLVKVLVNLWKIVMNTCSSSSEAL